MRISTFLLGACVFCSYAEDSHSQNARVSINKNNSQLEEILNEIESQTDYLFIYNNQVDVNRKVSVKAKTKPVSEVLDNLFKNAGIEYEMEGTHIILSSKSRDAIAATQQQTHVLTGRIVDNNGEAIIGANVVVKGTTNGTVTDIDGNFSIEADPNSVLNISYIGYLSKEIVVGNQKTINVVLLEDTKTLDEVVVIGYGTQKKADLTGSVANVSTDDLNTQSNTTIGQALQGKIAGVDIVSQGGAPGGSTRVMVRGIGTLNNSSPLYIVDGMYMSGIDHINPNDIASIDVLKDASSAAIYGSRAANGVVIVTTKEGSNTEGKPIIDLSANVGVSSPSKYLDLLDAAGWAEVTTVSRRAAGLSPLEMAQDLASKPDNDWQDLMFGPALMQNYALSVKGGGKYSTYYNSVGYTNQDGVMKGTNYQRYTLQSKQDFKKGIFQAGTNVVLTYDQSNPLYSVIRGGMVGHTLQAIPTWEQYDENRTGGYGGLYGDVVNLTHPLGMVDDNLMKRYSDNVKIFANAYVSVELMKGLKYKLNLTPDFQFYRYNSYEGLFDFGLAKHDITAVTEQQTRTRNILVENLLTFDRTFGDHKVSALVGYTYQDSRYRYMQGSGQGMPTGITEIDAASQGLAVSGNSSRSVLTSILGRAFYSYKNRYLLTATIRRDGSSKFGSNYRYGNFPSVSVGWNIAEEDFVKNSVSWLDQLKLRGGYGVLGNQEIDNYQYVSVVTTGINYPDGKSGLIQGAFPKTFANPDIKWEETAMTNVGIDASLLNGNLDFSFEFFDKRTSDILRKVTLPDQVGGLDGPIRNIGEVSNKGFELNMGYRNNIGNFRYEVNGNMTFIKNKIVSLKGQTIIDGMFILEEGKPIDSYYMLHAIGIFQSEEEIKNSPYQTAATKPGYLKFEDTNGDGKITEDDRQIRGGVIPKITYGFNINLGYKDWDLSAFFQGVTDVYTYGDRIGATPLWFGCGLPEQWLTDAWTPERGTSATLPILTTYEGCLNENFRTNDFWLRNASYLRLKNLQLSYNVPVSFLKSGVVKRLKVFVNAQNLFTFSPMKDFDPEKNLKGSNWYAYPSVRTYTAGVNVTF